MMMTERISVNPNICHGQACIKGTRIPVHQIIRMLANGDRIEQLLEDYPSLNAADIYACLNYAASLAEEQITPIDMFENVNGRDAGRISKRLEISLQISCSRLKPRACSIN